MNRIFVYLKAQWINMHTLIAAFIFLLATSVFCQEQIQLELHQDARLAVLGDDHGNSPGTLDFKVGVALQGKQFEHYYFEVKPQFEYANLSGGKYVSWLMNGGWVLNKMIKNFEAGAYLTTGFLHRFGTSYMIFGGTFELSYRLTKKLKLGAMLQILNSPDLKDKWGDDKLRKSVYGGIKYVIWN